MDLSRITQEKILLLVDELRLMMTNWLSTSSHKPELVATNPSVTIERAEKKTSSNVLIVDDEPSFRKFLRVVLEGAGHEVREAENGRTGLALYGQQPADLVIADLGMPEMTGLDMMAAMQRDFGYVKTFVVSGRDEEELCCRRSPWVRKPSGPSHLISTSFCWLFERKSEPSGRQSILHR